jgi:hypothetical protein
MGLAVSCQAAWISAKEYIVFSPKKKKRSLGKLVAEKRVDEIDDASCCGQPQLHEYRRKER